MSCCIQESHDDMPDEDADDGSDTECPSGMWDGERSRTDGANFDDSLPAGIETKSVNALSHSVVNSNRVQQTQVRCYFTCNGDCPMIG